VRETREAAVIVLILAAGVPPVETKPLAGYANNYTRIYAASLTHYPSLDIAIHYHFLQSTTTTTNIDINHGQSKRRWRIYTQGMTSSDDSKSVEIETVLDFEFMVGAVPPRAVIAALLPFDYCIIHYQHNHKCFSNQYFNSSLFPFWQ
jgi:hypothetical protein